MLEFKAVIAVATLIRIVLIIYGELHDRVSLIKYTDVDYKVFSDAAAHVYNHGSPYARHTYRFVTQQLLEEFKGPKSLIDRLIVNTPSVAVTFFEWILDSR